MSRLVGIYREKEFSPGRHRSNDAQLLELVAARLRARGLEVELTTIDRAESDAALVFSMCQGPQALERLARREDHGALIVNSPRASLNTYRDRLPGLMAQAGVPFPATELVATGAAGDGRSALRVAGGPQVAALVSSANHGGFWLKRGDVHASVTSDVRWLESSDALAGGLAELASRGIASAAVQAHRPGDEIKFYAVGHEAFFYWFYSGPSHEYTFDPDELRRIAARAAAAAGLEIFGGDIIVSPSGELTLIDLNDWPSFAPCRDAAAEAIADHLTRRLHAAWNPGLVPSANESAV